MSQATGVKPWAISKWRQRNRIPAQYYDNLVALGCGEFSKTDLARISDSPPSAKSEAA